VIDFLWRLLQASIVATVMCGNIYWGWTPNGLLAGLMGVGAAYSLTVLPLLLIGRVRRHLARSSRTLGRDQPAYHRLNLP
jgi:hypothetical protein